MRAASALWAHLSRFRRNRSGATVVEFALVAFPFFVTLLGIFEISTMFFAATTLDNGLERVARQVRTGEVQGSSMTAAQYKQLLCNQVSGLLSCDQRLQIDVRTFGGFSSVTTTPPLNPDGTINMAFQFNPGAPGDVVLVRAFYVWQMSIPYIGQMFSNMSGGYYLMTSATSFRNEPFAAGAGSWNGS